MGEEAPWCWEIGGTGRGSLIALFAGTALPGTVCLSVSGGFEGVLSVVFDSSGVVSLPSLRTSFRLILGLADAVRHGEAGFSLSGVEPKGGHSGEAGAKP